MTRHHIIISKCFLQSWVDVYKGYQRWSKILSEPLNFSSFNLLILKLWIPHHIFICSSIDHHIRVSQAWWIFKLLSIHFVFFNALFCQQRNNNIYLSMVQGVLQTDNFYFSCSYDLTHTLQRLSRTSPDFLQMPLFERVCTCNTTGEIKVLKVL